MSEKINRIKEILARENMSQKELAKKWGMSQDYVSKICLNKQQPTLIGLREIARILDVDIIELLVPTKAGTVVLKAQ